MAKFRQKQLKFFLTIAVLLLSFSNCQTITVKKEKLSVEKTSKIEEEYFLNYYQAIKKAKQYNANYSNDTLNFILGEYHNLSGNHGLAFDNLIKSLQSTNTNIALASLSVLRETYPSVNNIDRLIDTSPTCSSNIAKAIINIDRKEWALTTGNIEKANKISKLIPVVRTFSIYKAKSRGFALIDLPTQLEEDYIKETLSTKNSKKVNTSILSHKIELGNYYSNLKNEIFYLYSSFKLAKEINAVFYLKTNNKYKLWIDGVEVTKGFKEQTNLLLSKGEHSIFIKVASKESDQNEISLIVSSENSKLNFQESISKHGNFQLLKKKVKISSPMQIYLQNLSLPLLNSQNSISWEYLYGKVIGSKSPPLLYRVALDHLQNSRDSDYEKVLEHLSNNNPELLLFHTELFDRYIANGKPEKSKELQEILFNHKNKLTVLLSLNDFYYNQREYHRELETASKLLSDHPDHYISYIFAADSFENIGNIQKSTNLKEELLNFFPLYLPVLNSLESNPANSMELKSILLNKFKRNPDNTNTIKKIGDYYFSRLDFINSKLFYEKAIKQNSQLYEIYEKLGDIETFNQTPSKQIMETNYKKAHTLKPDDFVIAQKYKNISTLSDNILFSKYSITDKELAQKINNSKNAPGSDKKYQIIYDQAVQEILSNNFSKTRYRLVVKLLTTQGIDDFSKIELFGDIIKARVIKRDGSISSLWKDDGSYLYFSNLEKNDIIDYTLEVNESSESWHNGNTLKWYFALESVYNLHSKISILVPDDINISFYTQGDISKKTDMFADENFKIHTFETHNKYLHDAEPFMSSTKNFTPLLSYSTNLSWREFSFWQISFIKQQTSSSDKIEQKVKSLVPLSHSKIETIETLRNFVTRDIRYLFNDKGLNKVKPDHTFKTLQNKSGDCKDKVLLLKQMLSIAGIDSFYSLVKSKQKGKLIIDVPSMQFDHAVLFIPKQTGIGSSFFIDATSTYDHFKLINPNITNTKALVLNDVNYTFSFETIKNNLENSLSINVHNGMEIDLKLEGPSASTARFKYSTSGNREKYIKQIISSISKQNINYNSVTLNSEIFEEPLKFKITTKEVLIPSFINRLLSNFSKNVERKYPLILATAIKNLSYSSDKYNRNFRPFSIDNKFFSYSAEILNDRLVIRYVLKVEKIDPSDYKEFRTNVAKAIQLERESI